MIARKDTSSNDFMERITRMERELATYKEFLAFMNAFSEEQQLVGPISTGTAATEANRP